MSGMCVCGALKHIHPSFEGEALACNRRYVDYFPLLGRQTVWFARESTQERGCKSY